MKHQKGDVNPVKILREFSAWVWKYQKLEMMVAAAIVLSVLVWLDQNGNFSARY